MIEITTERLLELNQLGIIPGPNETTEDFLRRAEYCLTLKDSLASQAAHLPLEGQSQDTALLLEKPCRQTKELFDSAPTWIPIFFSNYQLAPWHGGCAWIFQMTEASPLGAFFQLRQAFRHSTKYLGLYQRDELIAHELAHVGRMAYEEPKFEEVFAYQTSHSPFRRWFGPIIRSSTESMLFVVLLFLIFIIDICLLLSGNHIALKSAMWLKLIPCILIVLALGRLWLLHHRFSCCLNNLKDLLGSEHKAQSVAYRLKDAEILAFAAMTPNKIKEYAQDHASKSLRWRAIFSAFF